MCEKSVKKSGEAVGFCVLFVCFFFFATDQAKQKMRETPSEQKIHMFFFKSKCMTTQKIEVYEPKWFLEH